MISFELFTHHSFLCRYGTLCSDHKSSGAADDGKKSKDSKGKASTSEKSTKSRPKKNKGLFSVEWFRVGEMLSRLTFFQSQELTSFPTLFCIVLDEAHLIKSRNTRNAKACYALQAEKRWALSGTPITNKLEDLYSLLHFIQVSRPTFQLHCRANDFFLSWHLGVISHSTRLSSLLRSKGRIQRLSRQFNSFWNQFVSFFFLLNVVKTKKLTTTIFISSTSTRKKYERQGWESYCRNT